jgi:hypothetical protein
MTRGLLFWILMILWFLSWFAGSVFKEFPIWGSNVLAFILFALLGWEVYGPALKG